MSMADEMACLARKIVSSYEARVSSVVQIVEATQEMLETFRHEREEMRTQLRETLARAASLRKRDFDGMIQGVLTRLDAREEVIKQTLRAHLHEQQALASTLKESLSAHLQEPPARAVQTDAERVPSVEAVLGEILTGRQDYERCVRALLAEYRGEQEQLVSAFGALLSNGHAMKVKDFKGTLKRVQAQAASLALS
jgi:hypothetical protein